MSYPTCIRSFTPWPNFKLKDTSSYTLQALKFNQTAYLKYDIRGKEIANIPYAKSEVFKKIKIFCCCERQYW